MRLPSCHRRPKGLVSPCLSQIHTVDRGSGIHRRFPPVPLPSLGEWLVSGRTAAHPRYRPSDIPYAEARKTLNQGVSYW